MPYTPFESSLICQVYGLDEPGWDELPAEIRCLYRMAYGADVVQIREGASYDAGGFVPGPPYNNVGPDVNRFLATCGVSPGNPWCAAAITQMLVDSGVSLTKLPHGPGSVHDWVAWGKENNRILGAPVRGCLGAFIDSPTSGHLTQVSEVLEDGVHTIAGNTIPQDEVGVDREGYGIFRRVYSQDEFHCFIDLQGVGL